MGEQDVVDFGNFGWWQVFVGIQVVFDFVEQLGVVLGGMVDYDVVGIGDVEYVFGFFGCCDIVIGDDWDFDQCFDYGDGVVFGFVGVLLVMCLVVDGNGMDVG